MVGAAVEIPGIPPAAVDFWQELLGGGGPDHIEGADRDRLSGGIAEAAAFGVVVLVVRREAAAPGAFPPGGHWPAGEGGALFDSAALVEKAAHLHVKSAVERGRSKLEFP